MCNMHLINNVCTINKNNYSHIKKRSKVCRAGAIYVQWRVGAPLGGKVEFSGIFQDHEKMYGNEGFRRGTPLSTFTSTIHLCRKFG